MSLWELTLLRKGMRQIKKTGTRQEGFFFPCNWNRRYMKIRNFKQGEKDSPLIYQLFNMSMKNFELFSQKKQSACTLILKNQIANKKNKWNGGTGRGRVLEIFAVREIKIFPTGLNNVFIVKQMELKSILSTEIGKLVYCCQYIEI